MAQGETIRELYNEVGLKVDKVSAAQAEAAMKQWEERAESLGRVVGVAAGKLAEFINQTGKVASGVRSIGRAMDKSVPSMARFTVQALGATKALTEQAQAGSLLQEGMASLGRETWDVAKKTSALGTGFKDAAKGVEALRKAEALEAKAAKVRENAAAREAKRAEAEAARAAKKAEAEKSRAAAKEAAEKAKAEKKATADAARAVKKSEADKARASREAKESEEKAAKQRLDAHRASLEANDEGIGGWAKFGLAVQGVRAVLDLAAGAAHFLVGGLVDTTREMRSSAQVSGVTTRFFQQMAYAAGTVRFQVDDLRDVFVDLSDKVVNGGEDQQKAFKDLGVELKRNGQLRSIEDIFLDLADGFAKMEDNTKRTAYASTLLGETGAKLLPVLVKGSKGLREFAKEAGDVGAVLDESTLDSAEAFDKELGRVSAAATGLRNILGAALLPALTRLAQGLLHVSKRLAPLLKSGAERWAKNMAKATDFLTTGVDKLRLALTLAAGMLLGKFLLAVSTATAGMWAWGSAALIAGARAAIAAALPVAGWLLVGAVIALATDELYGFATGADSALGDFIKWLNKVNPQDNALVRALKAAGSLLFDLGDPKKWERANVAMGRFFLKALKWIFNTFLDLPTIIADALMSKSFHESVKSWFRVGGRRAEYDVAQENPLSDAELLRLEGRVRYQKAAPRGGIGGALLPSLGPSPEEMALNRERARRAATLGPGWRDMVIDPENRPPSWLAQYGVPTSLPSGPGAMSAYFGRGATAETALPSMSRANATPGVFSPTTNVQMTVQAAPGMSAEDVGAGAVTAAYDKAAEERRRAFAYYQES